MVLPSFSKVLVLFTLAISVSGLATPHVVRSPHGHRAIAARMASPAASPAVGPYGREVKVVKPRRKRQDTGRCKANTSSSALSSSSSEAPAPTSSTATEAVIAVAAAPTSSSSSTPAPAPETTSTPDPTTSTSEAPAPTTSTSDSSSSSSSSSDSSSESYLTGTQSGEGTYYTIGLGACGIVNSGDDRIAAVSHLLFDSYPEYDGTNPNDNPICGKSVTATYQGKTTTVTITDRCEGCAETDLDFSPTAFEDLADFTLGRIDITWVWNN